MKKILILFLGAVFLFSLSRDVSAQTLEVPPPDIRSAVPEADWVDLYCFEARAQATEAIARMEALRDVLMPLISETTRISNFVPTRFHRASDYEDIASELRLRIDRVCGAETIENGIREIQSLQVFGQGVQAFFNAEFRPAIESALEERGAELRAAAGEEIDQAEIDRLRADVEARLQEDARNEGIVESERIEGVERHRIEAEETARATDEVTVRAQTGEFGQSPDSALLNQMTADLARERTESRLDALRREAETRIREKYARLAEEEEARLEEELGGGGLDEEQEALRDTLLSLRDSFAAVNADVKARTAQLDDADIALYREQARDKKVEILQATLGAQIDERILQVEEQRDVIEQARVEGKDVPSTDELVAELQRIKNSMIQDLASDDISIANVKAAGANISIQCDAVRLHVSRAQPESENAYDDLRRRLEDFGLDASRIGDVAGDLTKYRDLNEASLFTDRTAIERAVAAENTLVGLLEEFQNYSADTPASTVTDYKSRLVTALNEYKAADSFYKRKHTQ